jgi:hypothetical protein
MNTIQKTIFCVLVFALIGCGEPTPKISATYDGKPSGSVDAPSTDLVNGAKTTDPNVDTDDNAKPDEAKNDVAAKDDPKRNSKDEPKENDGKKASDENKPETDAAPPEKGLAEIGSAKPDDDSLKPVDNGPKPTQLPADLLGEGVRPLNKRGTVLIDVPRKKIFLKTHVSLRTGALEMLVCLKQTKEHESIVALDSQAFTIHTALVALGMSEGKAAYWVPPKNDDDDPKFVPASGQKIDIFVHWRDTKGNLHREPAQHWIRHTINKYYDEQFEKLPPDLKLVEDENLRWDEINKTLFWYGPMSAKQQEQLLARSKDKKYQATIKRIHKDSQPREMAADFLFVGSGFFEEEGKRQYLAEGGYVICVANFNMAMIDISAESNSQGEALTYEAYTERIPPRKSEVLIELTPAKKPVKAAPSKKEEPAKK